MAKVIKKIESVFNNTTRVIAANASLRYKRPVETLSAAGALTVSQSGTTFILDMADESASRTITLPDLDANAVGTHYKFLLLDSSANGIVLKCGGAGESMIGLVYLGADQISSTTNGANGRIRVPAGGNNTITLNSGTANNAAIEGTTIDLIAISTTQWHAKIHLFTSDADCDGSAVFSTT